MEIFYWIATIIAILGFLGTLIAIYLALEKRVTTLEAKHDFRMEDFDKKIIALREDLKEQMSLFREELIKYAFQNAQAIEAMRDDHKTLTHSVQKLNDSIVKLTTEMTFITKQ